MKINIIKIILLLNVFFSFSCTKIYIGTNLSKLTDHKNSYIPGIDVGIGKDFRLLKNLSIEPKFNFSNKKIEFHNKSVAFHDNFDNSYYYDLSCSPFVYEFGFSTNLIVRIDKISKISFNLGPNFYHISSGNSKAIIISKYNNDENTNIRSFNFIWADDPAWVFPNNGISINYGIDYNFKKYGLNFRYSIDLDELDWFSFKVQNSKYPGKISFSDNYFRTIHISFYYIL
jgi:hypothetical protein